MRCSQCGNENRAGARFCDNCGAELIAAAGGEHVQPAALEPPSAAFAALPADAPSEVGRGRFEVIGFLGEGTRKRVYLARDGERYGALTAVGIFNTEGMAETALTRARLEAEAMEKLGTHPHLVPIVAAGQDGRRPFIASEYMPGGDLGDLLEASPERRLAVERALGGRRRSRRRPRARPSPRHHPSRPEAGQRLARRRRPRPRRRLRPRRGRRALA